MSSRSPHVLMRMSIGYLEPLVSINFLPVLLIVNSRKITKTHSHTHSVLRKMRYKKQNWMQG